MTRRDLVKNAIAHRPMERAPYLIDLCGDAWEQLKPHTKAQLPEEFLDNDIQDAGMPWWGWHNATDDWHSPEPPANRFAVIGVGDYANAADRVKALREKTDKYFLVRIYGSHFEKAYAARELENFLAEMAGDISYARKMLNGIIEKNLVMLENFLALPEIDGVLLGSDWGSQRSLLMSPEIWHDLIAPGEKREYDLIHEYGKDVWVHSCGNVQEIIPSLIEMGLNVLNPVQPEAMDVRMLKETYGSRLTFWGGISTQQTLPYGTPEEVKAEARGVRDLLGRDGGYILSPAQSIQSDVPVANVMALMEVAREKRNGQR